MVLKVKGIEMKKCFTEKIVILLSLKIVVEYRCDKRIAHISRQLKFYYQFTMQTREN